MKRFWTALAVAFTAIFVIWGCNDYGNTFQGNTGAQLAFVSPADINAGGPDLVLKVTGAGFVAKTVVQWNGKKLATTVTTDTSGNVLSVTAVVPAALTATPGQASVNTLNPFSGTGQNGLSNSVAFTINPPANPLPVVTSISPDNAPAGSGDTVVTITGSAFIPASDPSGGSQVFWTNGTRTKLTASNISTTSIQATVQAALLAADGTATISVFNPPYGAPPDPGCTFNCGGSGGGGTSFNTPPFTIGAGASTATQGEAAEETPAVSQDGRYVSYAAVQGKNMQVFVRDTCQAANTECQQKTMQVSIGSDGTEANAESHAPSISGDGRYVAFSSSATNLASGAQAGRQIYLRDTCAGASDCKPSTQLLSTDEKGSLVGLESILPSVSSSGRFVAFIAVTPAAHSKQAGATAAKATGNSPNSGLRQVFVRDTCLGATTGCTPKTTRISLQPGDGTNLTQKQAGPALSGNAEQVAVSAARTATLFTKSVAVDDRVFLAITKGQN